jgi:hypothetical protein
MGVFLLVTDKPVTRINCTLFNRTINTINLKFFNSLSDKWNLYFPTNLAASSEAVTRNVWLKD